MPTPLTFLVLAAFLSWVGGFTARRLGWRWTRCVGLAMVLFPFLHSLVLLPRAIARWAQDEPTRVLSESDLLNVVVDGLIERSLVPIVGLAIVFWPRPKDGATWLGLPPARIGRDAADGLAVFAVAALVYAVGFVASRSVIAPEEFERAGRVLGQATPLLALLLSLQAGLGEELLFRGVLQRWLHSRASWAVAIGSQALVFGLLHASYGSSLPIVASFALGLLLGLTAWRVGLAAAVVLHVGFDLLQFALGLRDPWLLGAVLGLFLVGTLLLVRSRARALRRLLEPLPPMDARAT